MAAAWQGGKNRPGRLGERLLAVVLLAAAVFLSRSVWLVYQKNKTSRAVRAEAETELLTVTNRYQMLAAKVRKLATSRGQEEEIRRNFPVAKADERLIVILDETSSPSAPVPPRPWWKKFWPFGD